MQYIKQENAKATVENSDTSKVMDMVKQDIDKLLDRVRETMNTAASEPIGYRYNIVFQAKDIDYEMLHPESDDPEDAGDIVHGFSIDNHTGIGGRAMIDSIELFVNQFKRAMGNPDFKETTPLTRVELHELQELLEPMVKALAICAQLERKNRG